VARLKHNILFIFFIAIQIRSRQARFDRMESDKQTTITPGFFELFKDGLTYFMQKAKESMDAPGDLIRFLRYPSAPVKDSPLVFLGQTYTSPNEILFLDDFQSRIWVTYRSDFSPCKSYTSDAGWGCMLRSGQMILASGLMNHKLGRDWRIGAIEKGDWIPYAEIVTQFIDSPTAPYSIHRIALQGQQLDKEVGQWFGPATVAQVIKSLVNEMRSAPFKVHVSQDGTLYTNEIFAGFNTEGNSALILVPVMLGLEKLTPVYHTLVKVILN
jgi:cysteine protease ATG4